MNMQNFKKTLCMILALAMMLVVVACNTKKPESSSDISKESSLASISSEGNSSAAESSSSEPSATTSVPVSGSSSTPVAGAKTSLTRDQVMAKMPSKLKGTTLTYFYWWDAKTQMEKDAIAAFEKATGITVKTEVGSYSEFGTLLAARIAAGNSPDLVRLISNTMYQVSNLQPITNSGFDFNDTAWNADLMHNYTYDGRTYATNLNNSAIMDTGVIYYNIRALQKAELEDPYQIWEKNPADWTWDKLMSMCDAFLKVNKNKQGYYGMGFGYENAYIRAFGARNYDYDPDAGKWVNLMKDPELQKRYEIMVDAFGKKIFNFGGDGFDQGYTLFAWSGPFAIRNGDQDHAVLKQNNSLGVVPTPTDSKYQVLYEYTAFGIPVGAKNPKAVPYYLRYVLDQTSYDMSKVWINDKAKKVMDWIMARGNFFWGENTTGEVKASLYSGTPAQVKSVLDTYYGRIQEIVDGQNAAIKTLNK